MRFLLMSDFHENPSVDWINDEIEKSKAEFVVFLGDVTNDGSIDYALDTIGKIRSKVYFIPGNLDSRELPSKVGSVAVDMHGKTADVGGYRFVGLGGSNPTIFDTMFELSEEEIDSMLRGISSEGMVLMTHAPSYGILDHIPSGLSVGSKAIRKIVEDFHPILAMSGHIHEDVGCQVVDGTTFVNPGPAKDGYFAIVDIDGKDVKVDMRKV